MMTGATHNPRHGTNGSTMLMLLVVAIAPSIGAASALWLWPGLVGSLIYAACKSLLYGIPAIVAWKTIRRSDTRQGLLRGMRVRPVLFGLVSGILIGAGILVLWYGWLANWSDVPRLVEKIEESGLGGPVRFWLFAAWMCVGNSLLEEFVFRWFIDSSLDRLRTPLALALPLSALIFTMHHVIVLAAYFDTLVVVLGSGGVFVGGLLWSICLRRWRSLVPGWISHAIVDVALVLIAAHALGFGP
ncbi:MAG: CPBP family glutamic-type intramembrane protease [Phycisphaerales bacterium]|nr:CPBP family glutamic-type intramembrane protease [Phycisphaerales bacterium]